MSQQTTLVTQERVMLSYKITLEGQEITLMSQEIPDGL